MKRRVLTAIVIAPAVVLFVSMLWIASSTYARAPRLVAEVERAHPFPLSPAELPKSRLCPLLVVQDRTFFRHQGIGLTDGPPGHTTLTQGVGKHLFFRQYKPGLVGKIRLMISAWAFDRRISKEKQLDIFLNRAYFGTFDGQSVNGFAAAASKFYGKDFRDLTDREFASILAMLDAPNRYDPLRHPEVNAERTRRIEQSVRRACREGCFTGPQPLPCSGA